jgi:hypothetical protein
LYFYVSWLAETLASSKQLTYQDHEKNVISVQGKAML